MSATTKSRQRSVGSAPRAKQKLRLWLRLLRTTRTVEAELRERLRVQFSSTLPRFDVLAALYRTGQDARGRSHSSHGLTMTQLSRRLLVSNGNATVLVDRLVADGLLSRLPSAADRRSTVVSLTQKGIKEFALMAQAHEEWISEILADIDAGDAAVMMGILERYAVSDRANGAVE